MPSATELRSCSAPAAQPGRSSWRCNRWALSTIRLANRTAARAQSAAAALGPGIEIVPWADRAGALAGAALLVNATSLGMTGQPALDLPLDALPAIALVNDIVYAPLETPLLAAARMRGCRTVDGLGMLLHQGRPGFRAWFGVDPAVDEDVRRAVAGDLMDGDLMAGNLGAGG